jgi:hypothetical protein
MFWGYLEWLKAVNGLDVGALSIFNELGERRGVSPPVAGGRPVKASGAT